MFMCRCVLGLVEVVVLVGAELFRLVNNLLMRNECFVFRNR